MRVVVLGAGYAGVVAARRLERVLPESVELTVVEGTGRHLVQHELHRLVRRPELVEAITVDLADLFDRADVVEAWVTDVDEAAGRVAFADRPPIDYEAAVVTLGAETAFYGLPGVEEHATPLKTVADAESIREGFEGVLDGGGRTVVGGAGLSGVQVAGELAALADEAGADPGTDPGAGPEILLLEQADSVAPTFPPAFRRAVREELDARGVTVRTGATVEAADAAAVAVDGEHLAYDQFVWTGGIAGDAAMDGDRPVVNRTLRLGPRTFGAGDAVRVVDAEGTPAPASAQTAIRQAPVAADNLARLVEYDLDGAPGFEPRLDSYRYDELGWVVSVGDGAVAQVGPTVLRGRAALAGKAGVGGYYLSKVGAVREAVRLVYGELGLPVPLPDGDDDGDEEGTADAGVGVPGDPGGEDDEDDGPVRIDL